MSAPPDATRFDAYSRYLELLERQLAALDMGAMDVFAGLANERDVLARAIDRLAPAADSERVATILQRCVQTDQRMRARLRARRDEIRERLRALQARRPGLAPYLAATPGTHLDRRF